LVLNGVDAPFELLFVRRHGFGHAHFVDDGDMLRSGHLVHLAFPAYSAN